MEQAPRGRRTSQQGERCVQSRWPFRELQGVWAAPAGRKWQSSKRQEVRSVVCGPNVKVLQCNAMEPWFPKALPTTWAPRWRESTEPHEAAGSQPASTSLSSLLTELGLHVGWQFARLKAAISQAPLKLSVAMRFSSDRSAKCGMELQGRPLRAHPAGGGLWDPGIFFWPQILPLKVGVMEVTPVTGLTFK